MKRRDLLKSATIASTGLTTVTGVAVGKEEESTIKNDPAVQKLLKEVGDPAVKSVRRKPLQLDRPDGGQYVTVETEIGHVRYLQIGQNGKLGIQFEFAERTGQMRQRLPEKYRQLPPSVEARILVNADGELVFTRYATERERASLTELTGVDDDDAMAAYNSAIGGFVVGLPVETDESTRSRSRGTSGSTAESYVVPLADDSGDVTAQDYGSQSLDNLADYYVTDQQSVDEEDAVTTAGNDYKNAISPVEIAPSADVVHVERSEAPSRRVTVQDDHDLPCGEEDWSHLCAKSLVGCAGCAAACSGALASGGALLAGCLVCVGAVCNFSIPYSCGVFLDCYQ